jgi:hypothetical protein
VIQVCLLVLLLSACTGASVSSPTVTDVATRRSLPTVTPQPAAPIMLVLNACVAIDEAVRIREGPGTEYETIGGIASGGCITILGRNADASWVYIETADNFTGWVAAWLLTIEGDLSRVEVMDISMSIEPISELTTPTMDNSSAFFTLTPVPPGHSCSPAYPDVCIPPFPPDLDCTEIPYRRFRVLSPDPHGFDSDGNGLGCE